MYSTTLLIYIDHSAHIHFLSIDAALSVALVSLCSAYCIINNTGYN